MIDRQSLQHAMAVLEEQRPVLGDRVTDVTLAALREKLQLLAAVTADTLPQRATQRKQLTILFANVSGFSGVAESIPDTNLLNIINLLWQRLDAAITEHGGMVDKHIGDAVMGLFGVPVAGEDDPVNAIRAALALRAALNGFINEPVAWSAANPDSLPALAALRLRIGINTGPVLLGEVGTSDEYTVIGDPVNVASRLEQAAPAGGILISHETYQLVRDQFDFEPLGPIQVKGKQAPIPVYLVLGARPRPFYRKGRGVEGVKTQMVGRDAEMSALQESFARVLADQRGEVITISGEAGMGKSRLVYEFSQWAEAQPARLSVLKGRTDQGMKQLPYALIRDLFVTTFGIQDTDTPALVEEKLQAGVSDAGDEAAWPRRMRSIAQMLGLVSEEGYPLTAVVSEAVQVRERALADLEHWLQAVIVSNQITLLVLEDVHWADKASLAVVDRLARLCLQGPLLAICVTRPALFEWRSGWGGATEQIPQRVLNLRMLNRAESETLVRDIFRYLPEIPAELSNLIVDRAAGNPFYVEELIKVLIEDGLIIPSAGAWRILARHFARVRVPLTLTGVLQARLDRLSSLERVTLQRAAVIGRVFWDTAVVLMNALAADNAVHEPETWAALQALEKRELIFRRDASVFAGSTAFVFKHDMLREVAYESVLLRVRPAYHRQVADWLAEKSGERVAEYASLIADHYELAGETIPAVEMHEMAAQRAQETGTPALALRHYARMSDLLADSPYHAAWLIVVQERMARLLSGQGRLAAAAASYRAMRQTAENDGDLIAQVGALNGLSTLLFEQAQFAELLENATRAEKIAWLISDDRQLAQALRDKSAAYQHLGDITLALSAARQAWEFGERLDDLVETAVNLRHLGFLYAMWGRQTHAQRHLTQLQVVAEQAETADLNGARLGQIYRALGELQLAVGQYDAAGRSLLRALRVFQQKERPRAAAQVLCRLGQVAQWQGRGTAALALYRDALARAAAAGDRYTELCCRVDLGGALVEYGHGAMAEPLLARLVRRATQGELQGHWRYLGAVYLYWGLALLAQGNHAAAQTALQQAQAAATHLADDKLQGETWRAWGLLARQWEGERPLVIADRKADAATCFQESLRLLRRAGGHTPRTFREQALTLQAWAAYEAAVGDGRRSAEMQQEAQALAEEAGVILPAHSGGHAAE